MNSQDNRLIELLAEEAMEISRKSDNDIEKVCWMVVHQHHHGIMPFEYDIREIDEGLYLLVLNLVKEKLKI